MISSIIMCFLYASFTKLYVDVFTMWCSTNVFSFLYSYIVHNCSFGDHTEFGILRILMKFGLSIRLGAYTLYYYGSTPDQTQFQK
jgi:hypothetical protein